MKGNPYVGPRPYERKDRHNFYGRDREARELTALILAERVVLFYAQSGAGKTSLLNAKVIPALEEEGFSVLPVARVGTELPPDIDPVAASNVFVFSVVLSLAGEETPPRTPLQHTLSSFLQTCCPEPEPDNNSKLPLLILDQFEELFTAHRDRWQEAHGFFRQLREALDAIPRLGVLLTMREDHLAELDPYSRLLPRRLRARFRMERLGPSGALQAVAQPAANAGCPFAAGVAERLVDDLRRAKVQRQMSATAEGKAVLGPFVEPVQLQVVCSQLWENLPEQPDQIIEWEEIERYGDVDRALTDFYESALSEAIQQGPVAEPRIRQWFDEQMITPMGTRGLALREEEETAGLPNTAVDVLQRWHLIRAETRAGTRWYELAHDRLVDPIVASNQAWANQQARQRRRRQATIGAIIGIMVLIAAAVVVFLALQGQQQAQSVANSRATAQIKAEEEADALATAYAVADAAQNEAVARQLAAQSLLNLTNRGRGVVRSLLLAVESLRREELLFEGDQALRQGLNLLPRSLGWIEHGASVTALAFSPDGRYVASGSIDHTARVWEAASGKEVARMTHESAVYVVDFDPNGRYVASGSEDGTIRIWEAVTGNTLAEIQHKEQVTDLAFSPDGQYLVSGSYDGTVQMWEASARPAPTSEWIEVFQAEHQGSVQAVAFSPDGEYVASGGDDSVVQVWQARTGEQVAWFVHEGAQVIAVAFSPNGRYLATGARGIGGTPDNIIVWNVTSSREVAQIIYGVSALAFSPDGAYLASGSIEGTVRLWEIQEGYPVRMQAELEHGGVVPAIDFSPDSRYLATASEDGTARVWAVSTGEEVARMEHEHKGQASSVFVVAFSPDGAHVASGSYGGIARVWESSAGAVVTSVRHDSEIWDLDFRPDGQYLALASWEGTSAILDLDRGEEVVRLSHQAAVNAVAFDASGQYLATGSGDGLVQIWDIAAALNTDASIADRVAQMRHEDTVWAVDFGPDGRYLASGSDDYTARLWEIATGTEVARMKHEGPVCAVALSPDGRYLATGSGDGTVRVWDVSSALNAGAATDAALFWMEHEDAVCTVAFSPDGEYLATGSGDGTVRVWDVLTAIETGAIPPQEIARMEHENSVFSVAYSSDGRYLVSGGFDNTLRVWDIPAVFDQGRILELEIVRIEHQSNVFAVAISPNNEWLASGSWDGWVRVWLWKAEDLIAEACARLTRNLTQEEWRTYLGEEPYRPTCPDLPIPEE